jgi:hypothetical protein
MQNHVLRDRSPRVAKHLMSELKLRLSKEQSFPHLKQLRVERSFQAQQQIVLLLAQFFRQAIAKFGEKLSHIR